MAGVPMKAAEKYIQAAMAAGLRIAIVTQSDEKPDKDKLLDRWVTSILTPGTYVPYSDSSEQDECADESHFGQFPETGFPLNSAKGIVVLSVSEEKRLVNGHDVPFEVAKYDPESGDISVMTTTSKSTLNTLGNFQPLEIIAPKSLETTLSPLANVSDS